MQLLLHAIATAACPAVLAAACPAVLAAALLACSKWQQHWELAQNCAARYLNFRPTTEEPASGRGERRKTIRDVLPVRPRASATFPCAGGSGLMSRATHCLEGHWVRIAVMAHPHRRMAVVCHLSLAQHGTSCSAVTRVECLQETWGRAVERKCDQNGLGTCAAAPAHGPGTEGAVVPGLWVRQ